MGNTLRLCCLTVGLVAWGSSVCAESITDRLQELFRIADEHNTSISSQRALTEKAEADVKAAKAQLLPDVGASLSFSYLGNGQIWDRDFTNYVKAPIPHWGNSFSLEASQVVYSGGALTSAVRMAELGKSQSQYSYDNSRKRVHIQIAALYLQQCKLSNRLEVVRKNIVLADTLIARTKSRHEEGVVLRNDVTRYELLREQMVLQQTTILDRMKVVSRQLTTALGTDAVAACGEVRLSEARLLMEKPESYWQMLALTENTGLQQSVTAVDMSRQQERMVKAASLPKVAVVAQDHLNGPVTIDIPAIDKNFNYWFVGVGVSYDVSSLYKNKKKRVAASIATQQAELEHQAVKENVGDAVHEAYMALCTAQSELRTREKSIELARQNYDVIVHRYNNGLALVTDMIDAANVRFDAELQHADANIGVMLALYNLRYVCGDI